MFSLMYIFLVGWFVIRITQQLPRGFPRHMDGGWVSAQNGPHGLVKESSYFLFTFKIGHFREFLKDNAGVVFRCLVLMS